MKLTDALAIKTGVANAVAVYLGTTRMWPILAAGITPVGGATISGTSNTDGAGTTGATVCPLPVGCAAGDVAVLTCNATSLRSFAWGAPANAATVVASVVRSGMVSAVYAVRLVQADIDAGAVSAPFTALAASSIPSTVVADVYRNLDSTSIGVVGTTDSGTFPGNNPAATLTIPGITTGVDGALVQYAVFTMTPAGYVSSSPPAGWTPGVSQSAVNGEPALTGYKVQATAGATGSAAVFVSTNSGFLSGNYVTMMFSLKPYNPTFRLLGTLPSGIVGVAWTGALTFAGDFTSPLTVDASTGTIPAWMGTPVVNYTAKTITWSGTPTTAQAYSFTPRATGAGGKIAVGPAQTVTVTAASTLRTIVRYKNATSFTASPNLSIDVLPTAGNLLLVCFFPASGGTITTKPAGFTAVPNAQIGSRPQWLYYKISDGTESSISASVSASASIGIAYAEVQGATAVTQAIGTSIQDAASGTVGPTDAPPAPGALPIFFMVDRGGSRGLASVGSGWTMALNTGAPAVGSGVFFGPSLTYMATAPNAVVSEDFVLNAATTTYWQWVGCWVY